jgi:hypothetical protein
LLNQTLFLLSPLIARRNRFSHARVVFGDVRLESLTYVLVRQQFSRVRGDRK